MFWKLSRRRQNSNLSAFWESGNWLPPMYCLWDCFTWLLSVWGAPCASLRDAPGPQGPLLGTEKSCLLCTSRREECSWLQHRSSSLRPHPSSCLGRVRRKLGRAVCASCCWKQDVLSVGHSGRSQPAGPVARVRFVQPSASHSLQ